jgi:hypothetical protein
MRRLAVVTLVLAFGVAGVARAAENPTGTWKWSSTFGKDKKSFEQTLKLKLEGDKLTGALVGRDGKDVAIEDGKFANDEVSFKVTRTRNDKSFTIKYSGKVSGDTIKGKTEFDFGGKAQSRDWEAKRAKE